MHSTFVHLTYVHITLSALDFKSKQLYVHLILSSLNFKRTWLNLSAPKGTRLYKHLTQIDYTYMRLTLSALELECTWQSCVHSVHSTWVYSTLCEL